MDIAFDPRRFSWRREDTRYALAVAGAGALVAFLVAVNFGIPARPRQATAGHPAQLRAYIDPVADRAQEVEPRGDVATEGSDIVSLVVAQPPAGNAVSANPGSKATAPPADRSAPVSSTVSGQVALLAPVSGQALDDGAGVDRVEVTFRPALGSPATRAADVRCADGSRRRCTWTAQAPSAAGSYDVTSVAYDRAGNVERRPKTTTVVVVGSVTGGQSSSGGLLGTISGLVGGVVGRIL